MSPPLDPAGDVDAQVAIVGCGPVGAALALLLADRGHRVVVLERWPDPYPLPRAVHFDHETARILQACGLGPLLPEISEPGDVYEWRNAAGAVLLRLGESGLGPSGWPAANMFHQPQLEAALVERLEAHDRVEVRRGHEVIDLDDDGTGATLVVQPVTAERGDRGMPTTRPCGEPTTLRVRYVVGCDGANSTVRGLLGLPVEDLGYFYDWLIVDLVLDPARCFDPVNLQVCDPLRPTTLVSGGPGRRRWEFMCLPGEQADQMNDAAVAWRLLEPWHVTPEVATLERHAVYRFQARWAQQWRRGRVLLAGDAAHQMPPFAGQGMCSGLRDAANLAWKLSRALDQHGDGLDGGEARDGGTSDCGSPPDGLAAARGCLLDSYERERAPHVRRTIELSIELGRVICVADPDEAARRDAAMAALVSPEERSPMPSAPRLGVGLAPPGAAHAGELFVQGRVGEGDGTQVGRFDDLVGIGWRLVALAGGIDPLPDELATWFAAIGGKVLTVGPGGELHDIDGTYTAWFDARRVVAALQRPDFYVFGTACDAAGAVALVVGLKDVLSGASVPREADLPTEAPLNPE